MADVDARSATAGWGFTPRPERGFAASPVFGTDPETRDSLAGGFLDLRELVWGNLPSVDEAIEEVRSGAAYL